MVVRGKSTESGSRSVALVRPSARPDLRTTAFAAVRFRRGFAVDDSDSLADIGKAPFRRRFRHPRLASGYRDKSSIGTHGTPALFPAADPHDRPAGYRQS